MHKLDAIHESVTRPVTAVDEDEFLLGTETRKRSIPPNRWKAASVGTINEYGELFAQQYEEEEDDEAFSSDPEENFEFDHPRRKRYAERRGTAKRPSIFDPDALDALQETVGQRATTALTSSYLGILFQAMVFALAAIESALYPILLEWALWDERLEMKKLNFLPPVMYTIYYASSATVGYLVALMSGHRVVQARHGLAAMVPLALMLMVVEHMDCFAMVLVPASVKSVVSQVRLPAVVLLGVIVFGRRQNMVQSCLILGVVCSVMGFALHSRGTSPSGELRGTMLVFAQSVLTACVYAITELTLQKVQLPFPLQMAQSRTVAAVICALVATGGWLATGMPPVLQGFNRRTWVCIVGLVARDWTQTFILKTLNSVWKALSSGAAVCITYSTEVLCWGRPLDPVLLCFVLATVVDVFGYSFSKMG